MTFFPDEFYYKIINQNNGIYYALGRRDDDWHERIASNEKEVYIDFSYIILKSNDDGNSWQRVYDKNEMPDLNQMKTFGDSLVFVYGYCNYYWHPEGCIKFPMLVSRDQGISWSAQIRSSLLPMEGGRSRLENHNMSNRPQQFY